MWRKFSWIILVGLILSSCAAVISEEIPSPDQTFQSITVSELNTLMETDEVVLINVHVPIEGNITGTDAEIPFDEVAANLSSLPSDKNDKIVVYCLSGSMGEIAAQTLVELGYSDVSNLDGGYLTWIDYGLPFEELP